MRTNGIDPATLQAALIGYELEKENIETKIAEIRKQLGGRAAARSTNSKSPAKKRTLSAAARKRIAAAQRKRWRAYKKAKAAK